MAKQTSDTSIAILKITNFSRSIVLFTLVGLSSIVYYMVPEITLFLLFMLILDVTGFLLLLISRDPLKQFGYVWVGMMSIVLILSLSGYTGASYFSSDSFAILMLSIVQLLALMKIGINTYVNVSIGDEVV